MGVRFFSDAKRPVHLGPYPLERLARGAMPDLEQVPKSAPLNFHRPNTPENIVNAMGEYQAMMDAIRDGLVNKTQSEVPTDPLALPRPPGFQRDATSFAPDRSAGEQALPGPRELTCAPRAPATECLGCIRASSRRTSGPV